MYFALAVLLVAACGARTGLLVPLDGDAGRAPPPPTRMVDATVPDVYVAHDAHEEEAEPPMDVIVPRDAPNPCPDAGSTLIYTITTQNVLMSFYPPTSQFTTIGTISCPITTPNDSPFSMAVSHTGVAYVEFLSGSVFRVDTVTAACEATARVPVAGTFQSQFGMGFAANVGLDGGGPDGGGDGGDAVETLYIAGSPDGVLAAQPIVLGSLSLSNFDTTTVAIVTPHVFGAELTGTHGGDLFGFYTTSPTATDGGNGGAAVGQIDRSTGQLLATYDLPGVDIAGGWAFGFWGGDFYLFTAPDLVDTIVQRFDPGDGSIVQVAETAGLTVVGAGVSTCAPER
jgi:hypothetical protein